MQEGEDKTSAARSESVDMGDDASSCRFWVGWMVALEQSTRKWQLRCKWQLVTETNTYLPLCESDDCLGLFHRC